MGATDKQTRDEVADRARYALDRLDGIRKVVDSPHASPEAVRRAYEEWNTKALEVLLRAVACWGRDGEAADDATVTLAVDDPIEEEPVDELDELRASCGFLHVRLRRDAMELAFAGNMGNGMHDVDDRMIRLGLFPVDAIRDLPSFCESGCPDYLYEASVAIPDLPEPLLRKVSALAGRIREKNGKDAFVPLT